MRKILLLLGILLSSCDGHKEIEYSIKNETNEIIYNTIYFGLNSYEDSLQYQPNQTITISGGAQLDSDSAIFWSADTKQTKVYRNGRLEDTSSYNHFYNEENWLSDDGIEFYYYFSEENFN